MSPSIHNYVTDIFAPPSKRCQHLTVLVLLEKSRSSDQWNTSNDHCCQITKYHVRPYNIAPGNFLMDSLMGGSSSFRGEGYSSSPGIYIHTAAEYGYSVMRNIGKVGPPSLSNRDEVPPGRLPLSGFQDVPYLSTQMATWTPGSKTSRDEQPVAQCLQPCSFPAGSVKEEAFCCLYQDDSNKGKQTTEPATYIRLGDNSCRPEQTAASSSDCFQVYNAERPQQDDPQFPSDFPLTHLATSVESATESTLSCSKSAQETASKVLKTDESQSRKEEKAKSDSCSENSDGELKGRVLGLLPHPQ